MLSMILQGLNFSVVIRELEEKLYVASKENLTLEEDLQEKTAQVTDIIHFDLCVMSSLFQKQNSTVNVITCM